MKTFYLIAILALGFGAGLAYSHWFGHTQPAHTAAAQRKILYYVDPMHPGYKSDKPGIAPDCGMDLVPVYEDGGGPAPGSTTQPVPDGAIRISADKQQLIGVEYGMVETTSSTSTIRAAGRIAQDETKVVRIHPKIEGWIYKSFVDYTGQQVKIGDPLLTIYSPDMLATEQEFLLALKSRDAMKKSPLKEAWGNSEMLLEATRRRLQLWDLGPSQIAEIERTHEPIRTVTLYSTATGYVITRNAFPSQRVTPETELYTIADLSRVWIMADVFESDLARVHDGQTATISIPGEPASSWTARVSYIQPQIDPATRTMKVRLEAANTGLHLKPDMFVDVQFTVASGRMITVPSTAVLDSGEKQTVFVDRGNGYLEPRAVEIGERLADKIEIRSGLQPGERIVTSGTFLIDSESKLKPAVHHAVEEKQ